MMQPNEQTPPPDSQAVEQAPEPLAPDDPKWSDLDGELAALLGGAIQPEDSEQNSEDQQNNGADESESVESDDDSDDASQEVKNEVNYDQLIPMPDGMEAISISDLKNIAIDAQRAVVEVAGVNGPERIKIKDLKDAYDNYRNNEFNFRNQQLDLQNEKRLVAIAKANGGELSQDQMQELQRIEKAHIAREAEQMFSNHPDWKNEGTFTQVRKDIHDMAKAYGVTGELLNSISSSAVVEMLYDLTQYRKQHEGVKLVRERVKKTQKAGSRHFPKDEPRSRNGSVNTVLENQSRNQAQGIDVDWGSIDSAMFGR